MVKKGVKIKIGAERDLRVIVDTELSFEFENHTESTVKKLANKILALLVRTISLTILFKDSIYSTNLLESKKF